MPRSRLLAASAAALVVPSVAASQPPRGAVAWDAADPPVFVLVRPQEPALPPGPARDGIAPRNAFGELGVSGNEGARLASQHHIEDPALGLAQKAAQAFAASHGLPVQPEPIGSGATSPRAIAAAAAGARYVVQVTTQSWGLRATVGWGHYRLVYVADLRLIDGVDGNVLFRARCGAGEIHRLPDLRYPDLTLDHAAQVKAELGRAADDCLTAWEGGPLRAAKP